MIYSSSSLIILINSLTIKKEEFTMSTHFEQLKELVETRQKYEELKALSDICFKVFETYAGITMEFIENCVKNEWHKLYKKVGLINMRDVWTEFSFLKEGIINRKEFSERMSETVNRINEFITKLQIKLENAEKEFYQEYDSFFDCNAESHQDEKSKYIFFVLSQPEVRKIIMNFLES